MFATIDGAEAIGQVVRRIRKQHALSQHEAAALLRVTQRYLSEVERGLPKILDDKYFAMLRGLGITVRLEFDDQS